MFGSELEISIILRMILMVGFLLNIWKVDYIIKFGKMIKVVFVKI